MENLKLIIKKFFNLWVSLYNKLFIFFKFPIFNIHIYFFFYIFCLFTFVFYYSFLIFFIPETVFFFSDIVHCTIDSRTQLVFISKQKDLDYAIQVELFMYEFTNYESHLDFLYDLVNTEKLSNEEIDFLFMFLLGEEDFYNAAFKYLEFGQNYLLDDSICK